MATQEEIARGTKQRSSKKSPGQAAGDGKLALAFGSGSSDMERQWDDCDPSYLAWILRGISNLGGAVTFGRSRDKAALSVTLLLDGERNTVWIAPRDDLEAVLTEIAEKLEALA